MHSLLIALATSPAPAPSPSLRPGLSQDQVTPGLLGFLLTAFIVLLTALLIVDMVRRIRRVRYRAQVEEERVAAEAALLDGARQSRAVQDSAGQDPAGRDTRGQDTRGQDTRGQDSAAADSAGAAGIHPEADGDAGPGNR